MIQLTRSGSHTPGTLRVRQVDQEGRLISTAAAIGPIPGANSHEVWVQPIVAEMQDIHILQNGMDALYARIKRLEDALARLGVETRE